MRRCKQGLTLRKLPQQILQGMKIVKFALPLLVLASLFSAFMTQTLDKAILANADAGALPETTAILKSMQSKAFRQAANVATHNRQDS